MGLKKALWAAALLGLLVCGVVTYQIYNAIFSPNTNFKQQTVFVYIPSGATFTQVKTLLKPWVKNIATFQAVAQRKGYVTHIKPGKYAIERGMNNNQIVNSLRSNNIPVQVTFNNQNTLADLAGRIAGQIEADSLSLLQAFTEPRFLQAAGFDEHTRLGMYLPNTYEFFWNTTPQGFRDRMLKEYHRYWNPNRLDKAKKLNLTPEQVSALAAIVQKETTKVQERPRVAGVYLNRLQKGMRLQADPTVIYALQKEHGLRDTLIKRLLYRDLHIDSPYNTYKYPGLPPGPVAMPDLSSIEAVLNPEQHRYLYFVADISNPGYHKFAHTLVQHNQNKIQYIRWLNTQNILR